MPVFYRQLYAANVGDLIRALIYYLQKRLVQGLATCWFQHGVRVGFLSASCPICCTADSEFNARLCGFAVLDAESIVFQAKVYATFRVKFIEFMAGGNYKTFLITVFTNNPVCFRFSGCESTWTRTIRLFFLKHFRHHHWKTIKPQMRVNIMGLTRRSCCLSFLDFSVMKNACSFNVSFGK